MRWPQHKPLLYLITDRQALRHSPELAAATTQSQIEAIRTATKSGCQLIQIREKDLTAKSLGEFTSAAISVARPHGARVLVNDRFDVAIAAGADGVHLRVSSIPAREIRAVAEDRGIKDFLIGVSTHSLAEAKAAEEGGADFIVCGPVYHTPSKLAYGAPLGLERFAEVCEAVKIPALALGGINLSNFREPLLHGASGIAAISLFTNPGKIEQNIQTILNAQLTR